MSWINKIKNKVNLILGLFISQFFLMSTAFAQFAEPGPNDISRSFLNELFGSLLDGGVDAFGGSIATFNGAILTVGGILAAYTILSATLSTAHDGEMLGKKFSSVYLPIRYALGTALVLPILSGGYCVMQALVMWIVMQGAGLANIVWKAYSTNPPALKAPVSASTKLAIKRFVEDVYLAQVCVAAHAQAEKESPSMLGSVIPYEYRAKHISDKLGRTTSNGAGGAVVGTYGVWKFGDQNSLFKSGTCGEVEEPGKPQVRINQFGHSKTVKSLLGVEQSFTVVDLTPIYNAHITSIANVVQKTGELAAKAIIKPDDVQYSEISSITDSYINSINSAVNGVTTAQQNLQNSASDQGWFMAGTWVTKIIFAQNKINAMVNQTGRANLTTYKVNNSSADTVARYSSQGYTFMIPYRPEITGIASNSSDKKDKDAQGSPTGIGGTVSSLMSNLVTGIDLEDIKNDDRHPLIIMIRVGDGILGSVLTGITVSAGIAFAAGTTILGNGTGTTAATFVIFSVLAGPLLAFIAIGGMLTFILPNLPFMLWMGIIIGWTIMVIEAIIAAPLWAVMHLHPNGDDLTGRGGNGYMLVLGLLLRPVLIIFGLIAAIVLSGLFGQFVNRVFFEVFSSNMGDSGVGFWGMIFGTGVYAAIMLTVIKQTFNLMHVIPDQLMRWIGGGGEQLGQYSGSFSGEGMAKAAAVGGAITGYVASGAVKDTGQLGGQVAQLKAQKDGNDAQKQSGYSKADADWGGGAGGIMSHIDQDNSKNQKNATAEKSKFASSMDSLGGKNSEAAASYRSNIAETLEKNPGMTFSQAHEHVDSANGQTQSAYQKSFDQHYGEGAHDAATKLASGAGNKGSASYDANFDRASSSFAAKIQQFGGGASGKAALGEAINNAKISHANKEPISVKGEMTEKASFGQHLQHHLGIKKAELSMAAMGGSESLASFSNASAGGTSNGGVSGTDSVSPTSNGAIDGGQKLGSGDEEA